MPGKPYMNKPEASKYGKKHDRLRSRAKTLDEKSMDPNNPVSDNKFNRLQNRATAKFDKAREIRNKVDESPNTMKPYQAHHPMKMNHSAMKMKSPYNMKPGILRHMKGN